MDTIQIDEIKNSYYEYAAKLSDGINIIVNLLANNELESAFNNLSNLAEGIEYLTKIEEAFKSMDFVINSRIVEAYSIFQEINESIENQDYIYLKDLLQYELLPLFNSASEWQFIKQGE